MKLDMHVHTNRSSDGRASPRDVLKQAKKAGLGGLCITDHNTMAGNTEARKVASEFGLLVIRGMEISCSQGHVLGIGISQEVPRDLSAEETFSRIRDQGGIAIAPHPYRYWSGLGEEAVRAAKPDAIETLNSHSTAKDNRLAAGLAQSMSLPVSAGSDAHELGIIGRACIEIPDCATEDEALAHILAGRAKPVGKSRSLPGTLRDRTETVIHWVGRGFRKM